MKTELKTVRKQMTAGDLRGVIDLPDYADNQRVEVTVYPTAEEENLSPEELKKIIKSLAGCLKGADTSKTLDDWRKERLEERYGIKFVD